LRPLLDVIERKLEDKKDRLEVGLEEEPEKKDSLEETTNKKRIPRKKPGISSYINSWRESTW